MLASYQGYLIDLDGTIYRGKKVIEESRSFIRALSERQIPYMFLTNNSSRTAAEVAENLKRMGVEATARHVYTSSMGMAAYVRKHWRGQSVSAYVIGSRGLIQALEEIGVQFTDEHPDAVIVGIDRTFTYEKLAKAQKALCNGAILLATNGDEALPTEQGYMPGNGSIVAAIATASATKPTFIGKPESWIVEQALAALGTAKSNTLLVGDNYNTDILAGIRAGLPTLHVGTGVTSKQELAKKEVQPTHSVVHLQQKLLGE
ncbi:4-nitrophenyl phosphatase [Geomicrobium halophilum]|uniref:Acid sugar phosphatase n=1 Tax=Geomicrobium halophilum TaxID=549000 RepID=A0A841PMY1_9BACL|nr:TIGR01457 family HAD-type hydrolase [Geomicrobium halophilum]MBB6450207.1 4-nitrophenyl phosphatase [Geomicrobium halophilum]